MRAARYYGKEDIRVEEIDEPECNAGQIKVRPAFVGICGTGELFLSDLFPYPISKQNKTLNPQISTNISAAQQSAQRLQPLTRWRTNPSPSS